MDTKHKLALCLGKNIGGEPIIADLARMPHLLVAGTTGSGKSVAINTMILSLLYRLKPEECRLIMVDPKMLELSSTTASRISSPPRDGPEEGGHRPQMGLRECADSATRKWRDGQSIAVRHRRLQRPVAEAAARGEVLTRTVQTGFDRQTGEAVYEDEEMDLAPAALHRHRGR